MFARLAVVLLIAVLSLGSAPVLAQTSGQSAVLTINMDKVFFESAFGRRVKTEIERRSQQFTAETLRITAELNAEEKQLTEDRATLSPEEFRKRADAFNAKAEAARAERAATQASFPETLRQEQERFSKLLGPILEQLIVERGAAVVLDQKLVLYAGTSVDISSEAIKRINLAIGDGSGLPPTPAP